MKCPECGQAGQWSKFWQYSSLASRRALAVAWNLCRTCGSKLSVLDLLAQIPGVFESVQAPLDSSQPIAGSPAAGRGSDVGSDDLDIGRVGLGSA